MMSPTFLIIGLENGTYHGWNLSNNSFDSIPAHTKGVTTLTKFENFLISGDREGNIQIRDINKNCDLAIPTQSIMDQNQVTCMSVVRTKGEFIILTGDESGMITAGQIKD
jgi:hypothetical protein